jgi:hypothetical protein
MLDCSAVAATPDFILTEIIAKLVFPKPAHG